MKKSLLMLFAMLVSSVSYANIKVADVAVNAGGQAEVTVVLENENSLSWINFNISLPNGMTVVKDANGKYDVALGFSGTNHTIRLNDGSYDVSIASSTYAAVPSNGKLVTFKFDVDKSVKDEYYTGKLTGIRTIASDTHAAGSKGDVTFEIKVGNAKRSIKGATANVSASPGLPKYTYTGKQILPGKTDGNALNTIFTNITYNGLVLKEGRDYKLNYDDIPSTDNINAGTGNIWIAGIGEYKDTLKVAFTINKAESELTANGVTSKSKLAYLHALAYDKDLNVTYKSAADSVQVLAAIDTTAAKAVGGEVAWSIDGKTYFKLSDFEDDEDLTKEGAKTKAEKFEEKVKSTLVGAKAGDYKIYTTVIGDKNHNNLKKATETKVSIAVATPEWAVGLNDAKTAYVPQYPVGLDLYWDGETHSMLKSTGKTNDGTFQYSTNGGTSWSTTIPQQTDPGYYNVIVKIVGDSNHKGKEITRSVNTWLDSSVETTSIGGGMIEYRNVGEWGSADRTRKITKVTATGSSVTLPSWSNLTSIEANAFAGNTGVTDIYLRGTKKLALGTDALKVDDGVATIHTPIELLGDYALDAALKDNFEAGKVVAEVYARSNYYTLAPTVDVVVPENNEVYTAKLNGDKVLVNKVSDEDLTVNGEKIIKGGNGVMLKAASNGYIDVVASAARLVSNSAVLKNQNDYDNNDLVPVYEATSFKEAIYILYNGSFVSAIASWGKVPAGKAVLKAAAGSAARSELDIEDAAAVTGIKEIQGADANDAWYDLQGNRVAAPAKGLYIKNGKKVVVK